MLVVWDKGSTEGGMYHGVVPYKGMPCKGIPSKGHRVGDT